MSTNMTNPYSKLFLDVKDIQLTLGIGRRQAYELVNSGEFPVKRIGRRIKIPLMSFLTWQDVSGNLEAMLEDEELG